MFRILVIAAVLAILQGVAWCSPVRDSLAMFESGATGPEASSADRVRGGAGEISRFQILPEVWRAYSKSRDYTNPQVAWTVAQRILDDRISDFQKATGRPPRPVELYLLWNKPGHFAAKGYSVRKVASHYRLKAERFENLFRHFEAQTGGEFDEQ
ncbi:MAG: hypothetical protein ACKO3H_11565 [Verrucomicrobiota bacterium]